MTTSDYSLLYIDGSISEINAAVDIAAARKARLYRAAFTDGDRAIRADAALLKTRGVDETIRILGKDTGFFDRSWYFGFLGVGSGWGRNDTLSRRFLGPEIFAGQ